MSDTDHRHPGAQQGRAVLSRLLALWAGPSAPSQALRLTEFAFSVISILLK